MTLTFYLHHFGVQLEKIEEPCLATEQVKRLRPSTQYCFFHGVLGRGTLSTSDVIHGKEPLL